MKFQEVLDIAHKLSVKKKKALRFKTLSKKIALAKKHKIHRHDMETLKKRARARAVKMVKDKLARKMGGINYNALAPTMQIKVSEKLKTKERLISKIERMILRKMKMQSHEDK